jgi:hypothetical protein
LPACVSTAGGEEISVSGFDATPWAEALVLVLVALACALWFRPRVPESAVRSIEQHLAPEGTVMFIRPVLMPFGKPEPGARQFNVDITTPLGFSRRHTVEVDRTDQVRTLL